ncbi:A24 family peptidase [Kitasatospora sp. NPDC094015]|uniref:A24 family peptidase n=1 Tax=Kitasatospora sp. NPDC094015 TaxID=3155205 RepID=UPI003322AB79
MTLPWTIAMAAVGALLGAGQRGLVFHLSVADGEPGRHSCPACARRVLPARRFAAAAVLPYRCPGCAARLGSPPLVPELVTAAVVGCLALTAGSGWELLTTATLFTLCTALALVDLAVHRLPDLLTLPAHLLTLVLLALAAAADGQGWGPWIRALLGGLALAAVYFGSALASPASMGLGDAKLALALGSVLAWHSWTAVFQGTVLAFLLGGGYAVLLLLAGRAGRKASIAFGPFMIAGALLALLLA